MNDTDDIPADTSEMTDAQLRIAREILRDPWASNNDIAMRADVSRQWVVTSTNKPEFDRVIQIRRRIQEGFFVDSVHAMDVLIGNFANIVEAPDGLWAAVSALMADGRLKGVRLEFVPAEEGEDDE